MDQKMGDHHVGPYTSTQGFMANLIIETDFIDDTFTVIKDRWDDPDSILPLGDLPFFLQQKTIQMLKWHDGESVDAANI